MKRESYESIDENDANQTTVDFYLIVIAILNNQSVVVDSD